MIRCHEKSQSITWNCWLNKLRVRLKFIKSTWLWLAKMFTTHICIMDNLLKPRQNQESTDTYGWLYFTPLSLLMFFFLPLTLKLIRWGSWLDWEWFLGGWGLGWCWISLSHKDLLSLSFSLPQNLKLISKTQMTPILPSPNPKYFWLGWGDWRILILSLIHWFFLPEIL